MFPMKGMAPKIEVEVEPAEAPAGMEAVISALEQARAALDEVEAAAVPGRRAKKPLDEPGAGEKIGEVDGIDDEQG
jgi:hypothetical protein